MNGRLVRDEKVLQGNSIIRVSSNMGWCLGQKSWCKQPRRGEGPVQVSKCLLRLESRRRWGIVVDMYVGWVKWSGVDCV